MHFENLKLQEFLEALSSKTPTPGGGTASVAASLIGISTGAMSARFSAGDNVADTISALLDIQTKLTPLMDKDAQAFDMVSKAYKLPKDTPDAKSAREQKVQEALVSAAEVPLETCRLSLSAMELLLKFAPSCNKNLISDLGVGALLLYAGIRGAAMNVRINSKLMKSLEKRNYFESTLTTICTSAENVHKEILAKVNL